MLRTVRHRGDLPRDAKRCTHGVGPTTFAKQPPESVVALFAADPKRIPVQAQAVADRRAEHVSSRPSCGARQ